MMMNRRITSMLLFAAIATSVLPAAALAADGFDHAHTRYARVLSNFVSQARVDYAGLQAAPKELDAYLAEIASVKPGDFAKWARDERLALLLNLYNAQTLRLIIDHYPLKSIRAIGLLPGWTISVLTSTSVSAACIRVGL